MDRIGETSSHDTTDQDSSSCHKYCLLLPYKDGLLIAARILSVLALSISFVNLVLLVISILGFVLLQTIWCYHPTKKGVSASALATLLAGVGCFYVGLRLIPPFDSSYVHPFDDDDDDDDDDFDDEILLGRIANVFAHGNITSTEVSCDEIGRILGSHLCETTIMGSIAAFSCGILWFAATYCILKFIHSEKLARHEAARNENNSNVTQSIQPHSYPIPIPSWSPPRRADNTQYDNVATTMEADGRRENDETASTGTSSDASSPEDTEVELPNLRKSPKTVKPN